MRVFLARRARILCALLVFVLIMALANVGIENVRFSKRGNRRVKMVVARGRTLLIAIASGRRRRREKRRPGEAEARPSEIFTYRQQPSS